MKRITVNTRSLLVAASLAMLAGLGSTATVHAAADSGTGTGANQQARVQVIIGKGNQEIDRRLATLSKLTGVINGATKLSASDKTALTDEVSSSTSGLTALKTKLDADTDLASVKTDVQSIFDEYRVYALVVPKVHLVKTADDQQAVETKLTALAAKLQTRLDTAQKAGKDVSALQTSLTDMTAKTTAAQAISSSMESSVIGLQPSDYNSDHALLSGDRDKLKTAHSDNQAAYADAKTIVQGLKALK